MNIAVSIEPRIREVSVTDEAITVQLADGRMVSLPLTWSCDFPKPRLIKGKDLRFWVQARESGGRR